MRMKIIGYFVIAVLVIATFQFGAFATVFAWHRQFGVPFFVCLEACGLSVLALYKFTRPAQQSPAAAAPGVPPQTKFRVGIFWSVIAAAIALTVVLIRVANAHFPR